MNGIIFQTAGKNIFLYELKFFGQLCHLFLVNNYLINHALKYMD